MEHDHKHEFTDREEILTCEQCGDTESEASLRSRVEELEGAIREHRETDDCCVWHKDETLYFVLGDEGAADE